MPQPLFYWHIHTNTPVPGTSAVYEQSTLILSYWPMLVFAAVLPAFKIYSLMQARRIRIRQTKGLCVACGFDLRATRDRCPECGMEFAQGNKSLVAN